MKPMDFFKIEKTAVLIIAVAVFIFSGFFVGQAQAQYLNYDNCMMVNNYDTDANTECCKHYPTHSECKNPFTGYLNYDNCMMIESGNKSTCCGVFPDEAACKPATTTTNPPANNSNTAVKCEPPLEELNGVCVPKGGPGGPIAGASTLLGLVLTIIKYLLIFAGVVAVVMLVIGGFIWMTAGGNEEQAEKGRKALTNAVIGLVVVLMAYAIITIITSTLTKDPATGGATDGTTTTTTRRPGVNSDGTPIQ